MKSLYGDLTSGLVSTVTPVMSVTRAARPIDPLENVQEGRPSPRRPLQGAELDV